MQKQKQAHIIVLRTFCGVRLLDVKLVGEDEIRITLSCEEMKLFEIDADSFGGDETKTRRLIVELCERAGRRAGFDASADSVKVRLYPRRSGGCELFVSRIPGPARRRVRERIYRFDSADDLIRFAFLLPSGERSLLKTLFSGGVFYIRLDGLLGERSERILEEYGVRERGCYLWEYLADREGCS